MITGSALRLIGLGATALGFVATLIGNWVSDNKIETEIDEKVNKAMANKKEKESD